MTLELKTKSGRQGFTLIEMLVVIAIIGIIAALVLNLGARASRVKKDTAAKAGQAKLQAMIDNYKSKMGFYPPDNANLITVAANDRTDYELYSCSNQLLYELTGVASSNNNNLVYFTNFATNFSSSDVQNVYGRGGIANSDPVQAPLFYKPLPNPNEYTNFLPSSPLQGLVLPVDGYTITVNNTLQLSHAPNFWHYDASSTNRHNPNSYDLWVEYVVGNDKSGNLIVITNGNW